MLVKPTSKYQKLFDDKRIYEKKNPPEFGNHPTDALKFRANNFQN